MAQEPKPDASTSPAAARRIRIAFALHAIAGAFLFVNDADARIVFALLLAASSAVLGASIGKAMAALVSGVVTASLFIVASQRTIVDFGHIFILLAMTLPACIDAAGTSFREGRSRWLWARAFLLLLGVALAVGVWPAPKSDVFAAALLASHLLLRLGGPRVDDNAPLAPLSVRATVLLAVASALCLGLSYLTDMRFDPMTFDELQRSDGAFGGATRSFVWAVPHAPYASMALGIAFIAACLRVAPRAALDGAIAVVMALVFAFDLPARDWSRPSLLFAVIACLAMTTTAHRHIALRIAAGLTSIGAVWLSEETAAWRELAPVAIVIAGFVSLLGVVTKRVDGVGVLRKETAALRAWAADPQFARFGALMHAGALALMILMPSASLAALVPAVVFATKPFARVGTLVVVTAAWAIAPFAAREFFRAESALAVQAWAPFIALAVMEAIRSRGNVLFVLRLGATLGACLFAIAVLDGAFGVSQERAMLTIALLPGAVVVQALVERAVDTLRPLAIVERLAVVVAVPVLAGLAVFEFVMRWLVSPNGFYPYWDLHPIALFLIDGAPAVVCVWLIAQAGLRRALPFLAPGGAMLAAAGVAYAAMHNDAEYEIAAACVALFCVGAVTRPPLARIAGVWCGLVAAMVVVLRHQLPRPDVVADTGYPLWVVLWFTPLVAALVLSDAMRAAPLVAAALEKAREPIMRPRV